MILEYILVLILFCGLLYFVFDVALEIIFSILGMVLSLIFLGFIIGVGIHLSQLMF